MAFLPSSPPPAGPTRTAPTGFTLVEMLITVVIGAILVAAAVPSFRGALAQSDMNGRAAALSRAINLARSEAVKRARPVAVCRSDAPEVAVPVCAGAGGDWSSGWVVFVDNLNGNANVIDGNDVVIQVQQAFRGNATITSNGGQPTIRFNAMGLATGMQQTFTFTPPDGVDIPSKTLVLNTTGRWQQSKAP